MPKHPALFIASEIASLAVEKQHPLDDPTEIADRIWNHHSNGLWLETKQIGTIVNTMVRVPVRLTPTMILKISHYLQQDVSKFQQDFPSEWETQHFLRNPTTWAVASQFLVRHKDYENVIFVM